MNLINTARPSESTTATISTIVGALVLILSGFGITVDTKIVAGALVILGYVPALITWITSKKQRAGVKSSATDGTVLPSSPPAP